MKRRIFTAILASLMLLSATACSTGGDDTESTAAQTQAATEEDTAFFPDVEKQDYEGATFRIIAASGEGGWYYAEEYKNQSGNVSVLNNTIYEMNTLVE